MSTARQAAERILDHVSTRWPIVRVNDVANIIQEAIDTATADITRERDEAREAARRILNWPALSDNRHCEYVERWPWLRGEK